MKRVRYVVAMSLDGYIAGPNGESNWIRPDPEIDFAALWNQFDTLLMGRRTYEAAIARLGAAAFKGSNVVVASTTLLQSDHPGITILGQITHTALDRLRSQSAKDIWLMGGGQFFALLLGTGQVDSVEVTIMPVLLGGGVPLLPHPALRTNMVLTGRKVYRSGIVSLMYEIQK